MCWGGESCHFLSDSFSPRQVIAIHCLAEDQSIFGSWTSRRLIDVRFIFSSFDGGAEKEDCA